MKHLDYLIKVVVMKIIKIKRLPGNEDIYIPTKMTELSAGFDLYAAVNEPVTINPMERKLIPTGFAIELLPNMEAQIRPRSGLSLKHGITLLNTPGTIDADYRGEIKVILINLGQEPFIVNRNERIAQMVINELPQIKLKEVTEIDDTSRGNGGFGHTGK